MAVRKILSVLVVLVFYWGGNTSKLLAQGTDLGTIRGTVTDSSGAVVPNAQIEIIDLATQATYRATTNSLGSYEASALQPGHYKATISAPGFATSVVNGIDLTSTSVVSANAVLFVSSSTTNVEVSSNAATIDTQDQTISMMLEPKAVIELPRDSRDIYQFLYINPNITQGAENGSFKFLGA